MVHLSSLTLDGLCYTASRHHSRKFSWFHWIPRIARPRLKFSPTWRVLNILPITVGLVQQVVQCLLAPAFSRRVFTFQTDEHEAGALALWDHHLPRQNHILTASWRIDRLVPRVPSSFHFQSSSLFRSFCLTVSDLNFPLNFPRHFHLKTLPELRKTSNDSLDLNFRCGRAEKKQAHWESFHKPRFCLRTTSLCSTTHRKFVSSSDYFIFVPSPASHCFTSLIFVSCCHLSIFLRVQYQLRPGSARLFLLAPVSPALSIVRLSAHMSGTLH